jgi:uncharacterized integral membrane protein
MAESERRQGSPWVAVLIGIAALLLVIIALQNAATVEFKLLFWTFGMSKILVIIIAALLGFILGLFVQQLTHMKKK